MKTLTGVSALVLAGCLALPLAVAQAAPAPVQAKKPTLTNIEDFSKNPAYAKYYKAPVTWNHDACVGSSLEYATDYECSRLVVPKDWSDLSKGELTLSISRKIGVETAGKRFLLSNPGGPAQEGMWFGAKLITEWLNIEKTHVGIGVDPRGVGASTPILCSSAQRTIYSPGNYLADGDARTFTAEGVRIAAQDRRTVVRKCTEENKDLSPYINSYQTARDFNFIAGKLGAKTDFYGISYGAWLAGIIAKMFPETFERVVADGNPNWFAPLEQTFNNFDETMQASFDRQLLPYLAAHDDIYHLGTTVKAVNASYEKARKFARPGSFIADSPDTFDFLMRGGLYGSPGYHQAGATMGALIAEGTKSNPTAQPKTAPKGTGDQEPKWDFAFDQLRCADSENNQDADGWFRKRAVIAKQMPLNAPSNLVPQCLGWPHKPAITKAITDRPVGNVLLINNEGDPATGYPDASNILKREKGDLKALIMEDMPWHGAPTRDSACAKSILDDYLINGKKPATHVACQFGPVFGDAINYNTSESTRYSNSVVYEFMNPGGGTQLPRPYMYFRRDLSQPKVDKAATDALPKPKVGPQSVQRNKLSANDLKTLEILRNAFMLQVRGSAGK